MVHKCFYKESRRESSSSNWHSSQPFVESRSPVSSSSGIIWLTDSIITFWLGIDEGTSVFWSFSFFSSSTTLSSFFVSFLLLYVSMFSISVSPHIDMFERMLCLRSPVTWDGRYRFVFRAGFSTSCWCFVRGTRTVKLDRLLERRDSSRRSRSSFQKPPLPGSSLDRATFTKHLLRDRLWRIEF